MLVGCWSSVTDPSLTWMTVGIRSLGGRVESLAQRENVQLANSSTVTAVGAMPHENGHLMYRSGDLHTAGLRST